MSVQFRPIAEGQNNRVVTSDDQLPPIPIHVVAIDAITRTPRSASRRQQKDAIEVKRPEESPIPQDEEFPESISSIASPIDPIFNSPSGRSSVISEFNPSRASTGSTPNAEIESESPFSIPTPVISSTTPIAATPSPNPETAISIETKPPEETRDQLLSKTLNTLNLMIGSLGRALPPENTPSNSSSDISSVSSTSISPSLRREKTEYTIFPGSAAPSKEIQAELEAAASDELPVQDQPAEFLESKERSSAVSPTLNRTSKKDYVIFDNQARSARTPVSPTPVSPILERTAKKHYVTPEWVMDKEKK